MTITQTEDERATMRQELPEEEALDSLAARCRPFILSKDTVYHSKVLKSLGYFARKDEALIETIKSVRVNWRKLDPSSDDPLGYFSRIGELGSSLGDPVAARTLAYAWLYGDLVHADYVPDSLGKHDINARYRAGVLLITNIAVQAIVTLNLLRVIREAGLLPISGEAFTETVLARESYELPLAGFVAAPLDTPPGEMERWLDVQTSGARNSETDS